MDHAHGPRSALSDEADPLYQPLDGLGAWAAAPVDEATWAGAVDRLQTVRHRNPSWAAMVGRGALQAAAYRSGALDGLYPGHDDIVASLLRGDATLGAVDHEARPHVRAIDGALRVAGAGDTSEATIRRIHDVACRPQATHEVEVDDRVQDHVLATGDYKHHPNHVRLGPGHWQATAPVALVGSEMARLVELAGGAEFADLHPVTQAAYLHHALLHIEPFADGNGRVGRALAGGVLLRAAGIPFLPLAGDTWSGPAHDVARVLGAGVALVDLLTATPPAGPALDRWKAQEEAGAVVRPMLLPAVAEALDRYMARPDARADLSAALVVDGDSVSVRVPPSAVLENIKVEVHPEEGDGPIVLTAVEARLRLVGPVGDTLGPWLDRVVSVLGLRVAAERT